MGADIVTQVVRDLVPLGLENASAFLLAGSSAGGTGVLLNLDRVQNLVHHELGTLHRGLIYQLVTVPAKCASRALIIVAISLPINIH